MSAPTPQILRYTDWLARERGLRFDPTTAAGYDAMWRWSCADLEAFWGSLWDWLGLESPTPRQAVVTDRRMPGARWFPGAQVNYTRHLLSHVERAEAAGHPAIVFQNEALLAAGAVETTTWPALRSRVASLATELEAMGVGRGDRVVAYLPNLPETIIAFAAVASLGAVWSICSPDMGPVAVLDRFRQIEPIVLIACDGYRYGSVAHDRREVVAGLLAELPSVRHAVVLRELGRVRGDAAANRLDDAPDLRAALAGPDRALHDFDALVARPHDPAVPFAPRWLPFEHPLWVVYSSGTTGLPKPIVHGQGGVMLEGLKGHLLHNDVGPSAETGDRYFWHSSTGWIMWNSQLAALLAGTTVCIFDGNPAGGGGRGAPADWSTLWRFAAATGVTFFGAGAAFYASCDKAALAPQAVCDLSRLRAIGSTGSPLSVDSYRWVWREMPKVDGRDIWLTPISGGTDFGGAFIGGLVTLPVVEGEMQCRELGADVHAWSEPGADGRGTDRLDEVGELVCTTPMPSMPLGFWNDAPVDGGVRGEVVPGLPIRIGQRYLASYFDTYPGVWRHGDWIRITPRGGAIIYGRSDATINRHGIRMGTAELYRAVETLPEVLDSIVVDLEYLGRESYMPLFVVLREGATLDAALTQRLRDNIRAALSARHVPNEIFQVEAVPRTLSGKKMELPLKKLLMGTPAEQVFKLDAMANAASVPWFAEFAARRSGLH